MDNEKKTETPEPEVIDITQGQPEAPSGSGNLTAALNPKASIYLGLPSYNGENPVAQIVEIINQSPDYPIRMMPFKCSLLAYAFNYMWADALNARETHGITHFLLIHADIIPVPEQRWLDILLKEMEAVGADVLSVVAPLKSIDGLTSTGICFGPPYHPWAVKRYTMKEIFDLPETFTHPLLVVNTGMMLVDIRKPWVEKIFFHIKDTMKRNADGKFSAMFFPEDWNFSEEAKALGAKVFSTRKVKIQHAGNQTFPNDHVWGTQQTDLLFMEINPLTTTDPK